MAHNRFYWRVLSILAGIFGLLLCPAVSSLANVYATDVKINGFLTNSFVAPGFPARVSYLLNEPATRGVQLRIYSGPQLLTQFTATNGQPGALAGSNAFLWDGLDARGSNAPAGLCQVQITAAAVGYPDWTNINDTATNFYVGTPVGLDVNKNTNSLYYGRVFIANDLAGLWDPIDVYKFNADGSGADEGEIGTDGYPWSDRLVSPFKIAVGSDDSVYVNDWSGSGTVLEFDEWIDTNYQVALDAAAFFTNTPVNLAGPFVSGPPANHQLWMVDFEPLNGAQIGCLGVLRWDLSDGAPPQGADTNVSYVVSATNSDLALSSYDLAVASNGLIYVIQSIRSNDVNYAAENRVFCFPPSTNGAPPETHALWAVGAHDTNLDNASGVAVSPDGSLLAVAVRGDGDTVPDFTGGNLSLFSAAHGSLLRRFSIGNDEFSDVAWDNVGNLYATDIEAGLCQVYSPPGTNQATTVAVDQIQVLASLQPPELSSPTLDTNGLSLLLHGQPNVPYVIQTSTNLLDWSNVITNFGSAVDRFIPLPSAANLQQFYRAAVLPNP